MVAFDTNHMVSGIVHLAMPLYDENGQRYLEYKPRAWQLSTSVSGWQDMHHCMAVVWQYLAHVTDMVTPFNKPVIPGEWEPNDTWDPD